MKETDTEQKHQRDNPGKKKKKRLSTTKNVLILGCIIAACILVVECVLVFNLDKAQVEFHKDEDVYIECFSIVAIDAPEAIVTNSELFTGILPTVTHVSGQVDTSVVGDYPIVYEANFFNKTAQTTKVIHVIDTTSPVINLHNKEDYYVTDFDDYEEEGFTVIDNYDGEITSQVITEQEGEFVRYTVKDSSGNETSTIRQIPFKDVYEPVVTLTGSATINLKQNDTWTDPGATALDNYDGDVTQDIVVEGEVNTGAVGQYTVTYTVSDAAGNTGTAERVVNVLDKNADNVIYLTFDDGPSQYTEQLLDVLDKYNVKATFFVVNTGMPEMIKEIYDRGHTIGAHSYSHKYSIYKDEPTYYQDLNKMLDIIEENTGERTKLIRFPGGSSNTISKNYCKNIMTQLVESVERHGYAYFDWSVNSGDAEDATTKEAVYENIITGIQETSRPVILQHDIKDYSVAAVEDVIKWALDNGYVFGTLDADIICHHGVQN